MKIIVTGGLGFIGSNFIKQRLETHPQDDVINVDKITYASNPLNLDLARNARYSFARYDISSYESMRSLVKESDCIVNFAAESHVDNSIASSDQFVASNILGVHNLLKLSLEFGIRFHQVSTDEVFGSLPIDSRDKFNENSPYNPRNPYSATKASADFLVRSFYNTYRINATISNCSNNYGRFQHPEKLIPKTILNALKNEKIPIYGKGNQVRDWIHVLDHSSALSLILDKGEPGNTYLVGGNNDVSNISVVHLLLRLLDKPGELVQYVKDRPGHDVRYAIETSQSLLDMGWKRKINFEDGLKDTIEHYRQNRSIYENYEKWESEWN